MNNSDPTPYNTNPKTTPLRYPKATYKKSCRNGHYKISHIHHCLDKGRMCLCYIQQLLEMFIQHIQNSMCKSPQEKERSNQYKGNKILFPH